MQDKYYLINNVSMYGGEVEEVSKDIKYTTIPPLEDKEDNYILWDDINEKWVYVPYPDAWSGCTIIVPQKITRLQAKLQLLEIGLLDEVEDLVAQDRKVQLYWKEADNFYRTDSILLGMATALNLNDQQLDDLFIEASKL